MVCVFTYFQKRAELTAWEVHPSRPKRMTSRHALVPVVRGMHTDLRVKQEKIPEPTVEFFGDNLGLSKLIVQHNPKDEGDFLSLSPSLGENVFRVAMLPEPDSSTRKTSWLLRVPRCSQ